MVLLHSKNRASMCPAPSFVLYRPDVPDVTVLSWRGRLRATRRRRGRRRASWRRCRVGSATLRFARRPTGAGRHEIAARVAIQPLRFGFSAARRLDIARAVAHEILALIAAQALAARFLATLGDRPWLGRRRSCSRGLLLRRSPAGRGAGKRLCALREGGARKRDDTQGCHKCFHTKVSLIRAPWMPFSKPPLARIWHAA